MMKNREQQQKGRKHKEHINQVAISHWVKSNWDIGAYPQCLRDAMRDHRNYLISCIKERKKIQAERMPRCQHCMTPLTSNDIFHYGQSCHDCFRMQHLEGITTSGIPIPIRIPKAA